VQKTVLNYVNQPLPVSASIIKQVEITLNKSNTKQKTFQDHR